MYVGFKVILKSKLLTDAEVMGGGGGGRYRGVTFKGR